MARSPDPTNHAVGALRAVAVRGFASTAAVAEVIAQTEADVALHLADLAEQGWVVYREGRLTGWSMTPAGRAVLAESLAIEREIAGIEAALSPCYEAFLGLNEPMKQLCTEWQLEGQPARCVDDLGALHVDLEPIVAGLAAAAPWFASYLPRFRGALDRLRDGDTDAFTKPLSGSYHDVWMELHQDLLLALGRTRSAADGH